MNHIFTERTFANAALLSATVFAAFMTLYPPLHLSAQNEVSIDESVKVHKAVVVTITPSSSMIEVSIGEDTVPVLVTASTTIYFGNGSETDISSLHEEMNTYVFGVYNRESGVIKAEKIVIRNRRITERTSPSRADNPEREENESRFTTFNILSSIVR